ncbi:MAG TPA: pectin acetylesterase-family hydrolase, partial [Rudaea sp.]|nr:pectin acetylesterase-family hydrolase [Rudaea sp.]
MRNRLAAQTACAAIVVLASASTDATTDRIYWNGFEPAITAAPETWTWVPFDNAYCGDGSTTGIGVNLTSASNRLLIYLQEGGACWDYSTCYLLKTATNFTSGYGSKQFATDATDTSYLAQPGGFFDRSATANPFKDYSYVFVPYCTGDTHSGSNVTTLINKTAHFVGFRNMGAYLERLAVTFPGADRIVLAGSSAGGFGATLNWWQTAQAFPGVRVDMIDDSGAIMLNDVLPSPDTEQAAQRAAWNLAATTPPGCTGCATAFDAIYSFDSAAFPNSRGALLSYQQDDVLYLFYGIALTQFTQGLT